MSERLRVSEVFVPGKLPQYTYNPREGLQLEQHLEDYLYEGGAVLTVAGPTKTGKTVLLRRLVTDPAWVDGQGIDSVDELWRRIGDALGLFTTLQADEGSGAEREGTAGVEAGPSVLRVKGEGKYGVTESRGRSLSVERPAGSVVKEHLQRNTRAVVIDDFHFIERPVQRQVVRAIKPLVLAGVPVIFVAISHRVQDVVTAEPDMTGRVVPLTVAFWSEEDLLVIARKGFETLNFIDPDEGLARQMARESYGSPHLMQQFCRELVKANGHRWQADTPTELVAPDDWSQFFKSQVDGASADWFGRLLRGPQERGSKRTVWELGDGRKLDGYGVTLAAIASTGPTLAITKDNIKAAIDNLVPAGPPAPSQTTRVLQHMTKIAAKRATEPLPTAEDLDANPELDPEGVADVQPVLEYVERGPASELHIADPFFAFYVKWGAARHLAGGDDD